MNSLETMCVTLQEAGLTLKPKHYVLLSLPFGILLTKATERKKQHLFFTARPGMSVVSSQQTALSFTQRHAARPVSCTC